MFDTPNWIDVIYTLYCPVFAIKFIVCPASGTKGNLLPTNGMDWGRWYGFQVLLEGTICLHAFFRAQLTAQGHWLVWGHACCSDLQPHGEAWTSGKWMSYEGAWKEGICGISWSVERTEDKEEHTKRNIRQCFNHFAVYCSRHKMYCRQQSCELGVLPRTFVWSFNLRNHEEPKVFDLHNYPSSPSDYVNS